MKDNANPKISEPQIAATDEESGHMEDFFFIPPGSSFIPRSFSDTPAIDGDTAVIENYEPTPGDTTTGTTADPMPDILENYNPAPTAEVEYEGFVIIE